MDNRNPTVQLPLDPTRPPIRMDEGGAARIGNSRITLDLIVEQYESGMTPEDIVRSYPTLNLADVHAAVAFYLQHHHEVLAYLNQREQEASQLRTNIEGERPRITAQELLARRRAQEKANASAGQ